MKLSQKQINSWGSGINIGNTLDAIGGETAWNNPCITRELIRSYHDAGFRVLRLPVTWDTHFGPMPECKVDPAWMKRVHDVVSMAIEEGFRVILNTHHEQCSWLHIELSSLKEVMPAFVSLWKQIAEEFRETDDRLIFQGMNEPRLEGIPTEWEGGNENVRQAINALNFAFVQTVREAGDFNKTRPLCITTVGAKPLEVSLRSMLIPDDDNLILTLHSYVPEAFIAMPDFGGYLYHYDQEVRKKLHVVFDIIDRFAIPLGIPVMITEYGAVIKTDPESGTRNVHDVAEFTAEFLKQAGQREIPCVWWDNGYDHSGDSYFALFDRLSGECLHPEIVNTIVNTLNTITRHGSCSIRS